MEFVAIGESFETAIDTIEDYVEAVYNEVTKVFSEFHRVAVVDNLYEPLYLTGKKLEEEFNTTVLEKIKNSLNEWADGEGSYTKLTEHYKMGEQAEQRARDQQSRIIQYIEDIKKVENFEEGAYNFEDTNFEKEKLVNDLQDIASSSNKIHDISSEYNQKLESLSQENSSVRTIVSVGITFGDSIANFITSVTGKIAEHVGVFLDDKSNKLDSAIESEKQKAKQFQDSIEDNVESLQSFLKDVFD